MAIHIDQLCVSYGAQRVIDQLSLYIESGSLFTLLGPSGCGKTTLLRTLAGFVAVDSGQLRFDDEDVTHQPAHQRNIGMVFQDYALFPNQTVFDNVAYGLKARRVSAHDIRQRVAAALERVELGALGQRLPAALSGGQRQRVALARALVIQPRVLLMDEPLSNLDAKLRVQVRDTIAELQRESAITTVFVTHDQEEALALSDRIAVMQHGRIAQLGTPHEIYESPASGYVADFIGAANLLPAQCTGWRDGQAELRVNGTPLQARAPQALALGRAVLVARPEHIGLEAADTGGAHSDPAQLTGHVLSLQYLGEKTSYRVELIGGGVVHVDVPSSQHQPLKAGDAVRLRLDATRSLGLAA